MPLEISFNRARRELPALIDRVADTDEVVHIRCKHVKGQQPKIVVLVGVAHLRKLADTVRAARKAYDDSCQKEA